MYQIAHTYGLPTPPDDASLNLGVAWLRRLLDFAPSHALAVKAAYEVGQSYLARGKSESALDAFREFLAGKSYKVEDAESREQEALLLMQAQFLVGQILQGQEKFQEAIDAWKGYLAKYPDGPQSAEAQRAIVDTQLLIARDRVRRKQYDEARQAYSAFVSQNPLDARVPQVLFEIGQTYAEEKRWKEAISAWETLAGKFPGTEPAAHAQYQAAYVEEVELGHPSEAIERYKKVSVEPWASQARQRIAVMEAKALEVVTPRIYRSGETPALKITTRNLETLTFTAYKVDPEAYFRKKHALSGVESLDIGLVQPDAEWNEPVPDYAKYKPIETTYDLKKLSVPGMYVVKVTDEKNLQATTLVLGSDVDAIFKSSVNQLLVFAQDMKTGKGRSNARVLVSDGDKVLLDARTGEDGVLLTDWPEPFSPGRPLQYLVLDGENVAGTGLNIPSQVAQGLSARAYLDTDRPAYRPGQTVELRGVVREVEKGAYTIHEGSKYNLEVYDSRGRRFVDRTQTLSKFGTFHATFPVDPGAPLGTYRIRLFQPGKSDFSSAFEVQAYQLQKIDLTIDLPRTVYFRGETIEADVEARYQYGTPLANRPIEVALPDGRTVRGRTNDSGKYHVSFPTTDFAEEQTFALVARLPEDNVQEAVSLPTRRPRLPHRPEHRPLRLSRWRDLPPGSLHHRRPRQARRRTADRRRPQARRSGRPGHRARGRPAPGPHRCRHRQGHPAPQGRRLRRRHLRRPGLRHRPLRQRRRPGPRPHHLRQERRPEAPPARRPHHLQGRRNRPGPPRQPARRRPGPHHLGGRPHPQVPGPPRSEGRKHPQVGRGRPPVPQLHPLRRRDVRPEVLHRPG